MGGCTCTGAKNGRGRAHDLVTEGGQSTHTPEWARDSMCAGSMCAGYRVHGTWYSGTHTPEWVRDSRCGRIAAHCSRACARCGPPGWLRARPQGAAVEARARHAAAQQRRETRHPPPPPLAQSSHPHQHGAPPRAPPVRARRPGAWLRVVVIWSSAPPRLVLDRTPCRSTASRCILALARRGPPAP